METNDTFCANNPVNIEIDTGILLDIKNIQLTFEGAQKHFPGEYMYPEFNYTINNDADYEELSKNYERYRKDLEKQLKNITANIVSLDRKQNPVTNISHFSGKIENLTYNSGGNFDIGITFTKEGLGTVGYEMGDRTCALQNAIQISPPEVLETIKSNNIMVGLAWLGIALALIIPSLTVLLNFIVDKL